eukprot:10382687-Alexandrium_andersonii.AAC.1
MPNIVATSRPPTADCRVTEHCRWVFCWRIQVDTSSNARVNTKLPTGCADTARAIAMAAC